MSKQRPSITGAVGLARIAFLLLLAVLVVPSFFGGDIARGQSANFSTVYIEPVQVGGPAYMASSSSFWINVMANLTVADTINTFDVILNYSSYGTVAADLGISFTGNIFDGKGGSVIIECVDGVSVNGGSCSGIGQGQIHIVEGIPGGTVSGTRGRLFSVQFHVQRSGTSVFSLSQAILINPYGTGDPSVIDPVYVHLVALRGVFSNSGLVAFFNFEPTFSPAVLPGEPINFDAGGSFNANYSTGGIASYSWRFNDSTPMVTVKSPTVQHSFARVGSYEVGLNVSSPWMGHNITASTQRRVVVLPALGKLVLRLAEAKGLGLPGNLTVQIFNSSSSSSPFETGNSGGSTEVVFDSLLPGTYLLRFSGSGIYDLSKMEIVQAGLTTTDTVYLSTIPAPTPPQNLSYLFYLVPLAVGSASLGVVVVVKRRRRAAQDRE